MLDLLIARLVASHDPKDIIRHFREELHEVDLALDRWDRGRGSVEEVLEEVVDVFLDSQAMLALFASYAFNVRDMKFAKTVKFQKMLQEENEKLISGELSLPINRYDVGSTRLVKVPASFKKELPPMPEAKEATSKA